MNGTTGVAFPALSSSAPKNTAQAAADEFFGQEGVAGGSALKVSRQSAASVAAGACCQSRSAVSSTRPGGGDGRLRKGGAVGAHVGDVAVLIEPLGSAHRLRRGEAELASGLLLQCRRHERRRRAPPESEFDAGLRCLDLEIVRVGAEGTHPEPLDPARAAAHMRRIGEIVNNQMRYWNEFYTVLLESYGDMNGDGKRFMPLNDLNAPNAASLATGGGQATNVSSSPTSAKQKKNSKQTWNSTNPAFLIAKPSLAKHPHNIAIRNNLVVPANSVGLPDTSSLWKKKSMNLKTKSWVVQFPVNLFLPVIKVFRRAWIKERFAVLL